MTSRELATHASCITALEQLLTKPRHRHCNILATCQGCHLPGRLPRLWQRRGCLFLYTTRVYYATSSIHAYDVSLWIKYRTQYTALNLAWKSIVLHYGQCSLIRNPYCIGQYSGSSAWPLGRSISRVFQRRGIKIITKFYWVNKFNLLCFITIVWLLDLTGKSAQIKYTRTI